MHPEFQNRTRYKIGRPSFSHLFVYRSSLICGSAHEPSYRHSVIPACAGMTVVGKPRATVADGSGDMNNGMIDRDKKGPAGHRAFMAMPIIEKRLLF
jgi:hypothetical protein